jgi:hypothetical protein
LTEIGSNMKEELLDIDALLSIATGALSMPNPDIKKAMFNIEQAREQLLNLAEGLENTQQN